MSFLQEAELNEREMESKMEEFKRQIIEEERQKLLKAHAEKLIGYLPRVNHGKHLPCLKLNGSIGCFHCAARAQCC